MVVPHGPRHNMLKSRQTSYKMPSKLSPIMPGHPSVTSDETPMISKHTLAATAPTGIFQHLCFGPRQLMLRDFYEDGTDNTTGNLAIQPSNHPLFLGTQHSLNRCLISKSSRRNDLFTKGLHYGSGTVVGKGAYLKSNDMSKNSTKPTSAIKVYSFMSSYYCSQ
jgi:hypothetical protein